MCWPCVQQISIHPFQIYSTLALGVQSMFNAPRQIRCVRHSSPICPDERCEIMVWVLSCVHMRGTHAPNPCQNFQITPPDSADIDHGRTSYLAHVLTIWLSFLSHLYQKQAQHLKIAEMVRPTTALANMLAWCMKMIMGQYRQWLGLVDAVSALSFPLGTVGRAIERTHDRNGTSCAADRYGRTSIRRSKDM